MEVFNAKVDHVLVLFILLVFVHLCRRATPDLV